MQIASIEFARNVCHLQDVNSVEFDEHCQTPLIHLMNDQSLKNLGGTQRLGDYDCELLKDSKAYSLYQKPMIKQRHRHRYEFNNQYKAILQEYGLIFQDEILKEIL